MVPARFIVSVSPDTDDSDIFGDLPQRHASRVSWGGFEWHFSDSISHPFPSLYLSTTVM